MESQKVVLQRQYVDLLDGDFLSAAVLSQIVYWYLPGKTGVSKLRVVKIKNGVEIWWLAKSYLDWALELGLTHKQSRRCIDVLKKKGIIATKVHRFGNITTTHIRLLMCGGSRNLDHVPSNSELQLIADAPKDTHQCPTGHSIDAPKPAIGDALQGHPLTENTTKITDINYSSTQSAIASKNEEKIKKEQEEEKEESFAKEEKEEDPEDLEELYGLTVPKPEGGKNEIMKETQDKVDKFYEDKNSKHSTNIACIWKSCVALEYEVKGLVHLTQKEVGQLKALEKIVGKEEAAKLVKGVIPYWLDFTEKARAMKGWHKTPIQPTPGILLMAHDVATNFLQSIADKKPVKKMTATNAKPMFEQSEEDQPYKPTQAEIDALLESFGKT